MTTERPESADITCPQCSNITEVSAGVDTFCPTCDYPLFWADPAQSTQRRAVQSAEVGAEDKSAEPEQDHDHPAEEDDLDAEATDIICRNCALRNPGNRTYCMRCGEELPPPEEWYREGETHVEVEPEPPLWRSLAVAGFVLFLGACGSFLLLHFKFDVIWPPQTFETKVLVENATGISTTAVVMVNEPRQPAISYYADSDPGIGAGNPGSSLNFVVCRDAFCLSDKLYKEARDIDPEGTPGKYGLAMVRVAGGPMAVYRREETGTLVALECGTVGCNDNLGTRRFFPVDEGVTAEGITAKVGTGSDPSMVVSGGVPIVVYSDDEMKLQVAFLCGEYCNDDNGIINLTLMPVEGEPYKASQATLAVPRAGRPYIAFIDSDGNLKMLRCDNVFCSKSENGKRTAQTTPIKFEAKTLDVDLADVKDLGMIINPDTLAPEIAILGNNGRLIVLKCGSQLCESASEVIFVDEISAEDDELSAEDDELSAGDGEVVMARGNKGLPVLAYRKNGELFVATCTGNCTSQEWKHIRVDRVTDQANKNTNSGRLNVWDWHNWPWNDADQIDIGYNISMTVSNNIAVIAHTDSSMKMLRVTRVNMNLFLEDCETGRTRCEGHE